MKKDIMMLGWIAMLAALMAVTIRSAVAAESAAPAPARPAVDVVFVLDTTGSMGGLLEGAKRRIWSIANEVAKGRPAPRVRMGLVAFRDRGDEYVTKTFDLTANLDLVYKNLLTLEAGGGGDGPEHVLKGLEDAVERMSWSADPKAFRAVYLVGDAPPHQEYGDTPALKALLEKAVRRGLVVNSIQCGSEASAAETFRLVARLGEGRYLPIPQDGGMAPVDTPFDARLASLGRRLESTMVGYGRRKAEAGKMREFGLAVASAAPGATAADRAAFKSKAGFDGELDLVAAIEEKRVDVGALKDSDLPAELRGLPPGERAVRLAKASEERKRLNAELAEVSVKREEFIRKQAAKAGKNDSFDRLLVESLKEQAARKGIAY